SAQGQAAQDEQPDGNSCCASYPSVTLAHLVAPWLLVDSHGSLANVIGTTISWVRPLRLRGRRKW
ncbi:MAG: hypothetical protein M3M98_05510, partial [Nitrospirota bacterium]|nr:hypothetical protein [Nitrospirota bacterium]